MKKGKMSCEAVIVKPAPAPSRLVHTKPSSRPLRRTAAIAVACEWDRGLTRERHSTTGSNCPVSRAGDRRATAAKRTGLRLRGLTCTRPRTNDPGPGPGPGPPGRPLNGFRGGTLPQCEQQRCHPRDLPRDRSRCPGGRRVGRPPAAVSALSGKVAVASLPHGGRLGLRAGCKGERNPPRPSRMRAITVPPRGAGESRDFWAHCRRACCCRRRAAGGGARPPEPEPTT